MPIKDLLDYCVRMGVKHGPYFVRHYDSGGFFVYKEGWKRGLDVPSDPVLIKRYQEQEQAGKIKDSLLGQIAARAIPVCGKLSREVGRQVLGLNPVDLGYGSEKGARNIVRNYWRPKKNSSGLFEPTRNKTKTVGDFMREQKSAYRYLSRHLGSFGAAVDKWYKGLYGSVSPARVVYNREESTKLLGKILIQRFNEGLAISADALKTSQDPAERELYRKIMDLSESCLPLKRTKRDGKLGRAIQHESYTQIASRLTGLPVSDIKLGSGAVKACGELTEKLTEFLFYWSSLVNLETWGIDSNQRITSRRTDVAIIHDGEKYEADLRIGNTPIEVKSCAGRFKEQQRDKIIKVYGNHDIWENTNTPIDRATVIFHADSGLLSHVIPPIKEAGLQVVCYEDFHDHLAELITAMKKHQATYQDVRPFVSLDYLLETHKEVSLRPFLLIRDQNQDRRKWIEHILDAFIIRAKELRETGVKL